MSITVLFLCLVTVGLGLPLDETTSRHKREVTNCQPPANLSEIFQNLNQNINASVYLQLGNSSDVAQYLPTELNSQAGFDNQDKADQSCPASVSDDPSDPVWSRSICPWWYNITYLSSGHYPGVIPQAVCRCEDCVGNTINECSRVSTNIRVLRNTGCRDGFLTYQPVLMTHHVGCTCTRRRVSEDNSCGGWGCAS